ncbi:hypothetical protein [Thermomonospora catenispora]|uniref:hypothetical protein n=1 Tax=Thermomonospora catenispora TaxID=2493090 RepID=UPI00112148D0|nr:hypothetical protein [Thermomonospora catenispora]TNY38253.1 hypothetical protein EIO00_04390 [Thermomonospora catenispora]
MSGGDRASGNVYVIDAAPLRTVCDAAIHGDRPIDAVTQTPDRFRWCAIHTWAEVERIERAGGRVKFTAAARLRLQLGAR